MIDPQPFLPPGLFDSVETGGPFRHCIHCHRDPGASGHPCVVTKEQPIF